jgi:hypothetical protein
MSASEMRMARTTAAAPATAKFAFWWIVSLFLTLILVEYILAREQAGVNPAKAAAPRPAASVRPNQPPQQLQAATPKAAVGHAVSDVVPAQSALAQATANADEARNLENLRSLGLLDATYPLFIHCKGATGTERVAGAKRVRPSTCQRITGAHGTTSRVCVHRVPTRRSTSSGTAKASTTTWLIRARSSA